MYTTHTCTQHIHTIVPHTHTHTHTRTHTHTHTPGRQMLAALPQMQALPQGDPFGTTNRALGADPFVAAHG